MCWESIVIPESSIGHSYNVNGARLVLQSVIKHNALFHE